MQLINNKYRVVRTFNKGKEGESYVVENIKNPRSEERRVGQECHMVCRSRWSPDH